MESGGQNPKRKGVHGGGINGGGRKGRSRIRGGGINGGGIIVWKGRSTAGRSAAGRKKQGQRKKQGHGGGVKRKGRRWYKAERKEVVGINSNEGREVV